jgi:hypothetical protein
VKATIEEFIEWIAVKYNLTHVAKKRRKNSNRANPFDKYSIDEYWAYADYKYMVELIESDKNSIDEQVIINLG